jgi:pimeloyl-ACP methyl ester carboxylesterase
MKKPVALSLIGLACMIAGCGGSDSDSSINRPDTLAAMDPAAACQALAGREIQKNAFGLPTGGGSISSAVMVKSTEVGNTAGEYCRVRGDIKAVDVTAQNIKFQANLPTNWNGKALQFGGGGYDGVLPNTTGQAPHGLYSGPTPLASGYITAGSDSGHQNPDTNDASFGMNDEQLANFAHMHVKKVRDAVSDIARYRYGTDIRRVYFAGGSSGGRAAAMAALKYPESFDGVLMNYPVSNFTEVRSWGASLRAAIYNDNSAGWIPPALVSRIALETRAACDSLDGAVDGLVSNMAACRTNSATYLASIACKSGETGNPNHCLTQAQIERTIKVYHDGYTVPYAFANGVKKYNGYNILEGNAMAIGSQPQYLDPPISGPNAHHVARADGFFRYIIARNPAYSMTNYDVQNPGIYLNRLLAVSELMDATNPDWSPFFNKGGKVLLVHGLDDVSLSPYQTVDQYNAMVSRMGQSAVDKSLRFYLVPGLGHGIGDFLLSWNNLSILDNWVERDEPPPASAVAYDSNKATLGRSRPMCAYPTWARYKGTGSLDDAASYMCVQ